MLGDSYSGIPPKVGDTIGSQQKAGERWYEDFFRSYNQNGTGSAGRERPNSDAPIKEIEMLDLFPSPFEVWAKKIDGLGEKKPKGDDGGKKVDDNGNRLQEDGDKNPDADNKNQIGSDKGQDGINKKPDGFEDSDLMPIDDSSTDPTALQQLAKTVGEYEAGGHKLTPELRQRFESIIVASDSPSPLIPQMTSRLEELGKEGAALLTPEKKREIDETKEQLQSAVRALPPVEAKRFQDLAYIRAAARGDSDLTTNFETQMEAVAPGVLNKLKAYENAVEPLTKIENEFSEVSTRLSSEMGQHLISRSTYVDVLLKDGDTATAERYLREAYNMEPTIIENEEFMELMDRAGLKADDLKRPKIKT